MTVVSFTMMVLFVMFKETVVPNVYVATDETPYQLIAITSERTFVLMPRSLPHPPAWVIAGVLVIVLSSAFIVVGRVPTAQASRPKATCRNSIADAARIQSKINASVPGDEIVIKGPCLLNATIKLLDNRTYRGDARTGTVLKQANGANLPAMLASASWVNNVDFVSSGEQIQDLTLDGNKANNTTTVPLMLRTWNSRVYNLEVRNAPSDGIRVTSLSQNDTHLVSGNHAVNNVFSDLFVHDSGGAGFRVVDPDNNVTDGVLERSWIASSSTNGVGLDNTAGWQLRNLHIYGVAKHAIDARRCFGTGINDNYIEDFGHQGSAGFIYYGIHCTVQGNISNVIAGNKVNQLHAIPALGSFVSIGLDGNYGVGNVSVTGNAIQGTGNVRETGLSYNKGGAVTMTVASTGNQVNRVGTARSVGAGVTVTAGL